MNDHAIERVKIVAVVAAAVLPFVNALGNGFTVDDAYLVLGNRDIRSLSNIGSFFLGAWGGTIDSQFYGSMNAGYYRPLSMTLYAFEYALFGYVPAFWRAVSIALHTSISLLVYSMASRLARNAAVASPSGRSEIESSHRGALVAALVFAVHPVHSEVLNPATYQTTLLATLAVLCAVRLHMESFSWSRSALISLALLAGFLSKENALSAPLLLPLYDLALREGVGRRRFHLPTYAFSALGLLGYLAVRHFLLQGSGFGFFGDAPAQVVALTMLKVVVLYGQLLLFPLFLCPFYDWYIVSATDRLLDLDVLGGAFILVFLCAAIVALWLGKRRTAAFGLAWVAITLLPVAQLVPILNVAAERFLYLPSAGFCLFFAVIARWDRSRASLLVLGLLLAVFALRTAARNPDWRDDIALNLAFARDFPHTPTPHLNLVFHYKQREDYPSALRHSEAARKLDPRFPGPWKESIRLLIELGRVAEARELAGEAEAAGISLPGPPGATGASQ